LREPKAFNIEYDDLKEPKTLVLVTSLISFLFCEAGVGPNPIAIELPSHQ